MSLCLVSPFRFLLLPRVAFLSSLRERERGKGEERERREGVKRSLREEKVERGRREGGDRREVRDVTGIREREES